MKIDNQIKSKNDMYMELDELINDANNYLYELDRQDQEAFDALTAANEEKAAEEERQRLEVLDGLPDAEAHLAELRTIT